MRYIVVIIKQLPDNLNSLALLFFWNRLGDNVESMKNLKDVIKYWPKNLKKLELDLQWNNLGSNLENMR